MRRKIIKQGNSSYTITIPIKWIRQNNVISNEEISLEEEENRLIISAEKKPERKKITIGLHDNDPRSIRFVLQQAYRQNYDQIAVNFSSDAIYETLVGIIDDYFVGLEIAEKRKNGCMISVIVETSEEKFSLFLRKMFFLIKESLHALASNDSKSIHYNFLKLYAYQNYGKRYIHSKRADLSSYDYYSLLSYLLNIHSDIDKFSACMKNRRKVERFDEKLRVIIESFEDIEKNFYLRKTESLMKIIESLQKAIQDMQRTDNRKKEDFLVMHYRLELLRLMYGALSPLLGIVLYESRKTS